MVKCEDCGKEISENETTYCQMCGALLCQECEVDGLCTLCTELLISEIDEELEEEP